jgi:hypothetical protein
MQRVTVRHMSIIRGDSWRRIGMSVRSWQHKPDAMAVWLVKHMVVQNTGGSTRFMTMRVNRVPNRLIGAMRMKRIASRCLGVSVGMKAGPPDDSGGPLDDSGW